MRTHSMTSGTPLRGIGLKKSGVISALFVLSLSLTCVGCSASSTDAPDATEPQTQEETVQVEESTPTSNESASTPEQNTVSNDAIYLSDYLTKGRSVWFCLNDELAYDEEIWNVYIVENGAIVADYDVDAASLTSGDEFENLIGLSEDEVVQYLESQGVGRGKQDGREVKIELDRDATGNDVEEVTVYFGDSPYHLDRLIEPTQILDQYYLGFEAGYHGGCALVTQCNLGSQIETDNLSNAESNPAITVD